MLSNEDFWEDIDKIISDNFSPDGLETLDYYADLFISGKWIFKRFSSQEQYGCAAGGASHVIATILAGAKNSTNPQNEFLSDFKRELKSATQQASRIETWAKLIGK